MAKQALGKGLGALIKRTTGGKDRRTTGGEDRRTTGGEDRIDESGPPPPRGKEVRQVPIDRVVPSPLQPRTSIPDGDLDELLESIRQHGVIQPLIVRAVDDKLELIAGERRWRACGKLGLPTVPVIEREATDREVLEMALVENLQRQDLNPIEEASGYVRLATEFGLKQDEIAKRVGKSRTSVTNSMRLLDLGEDVRVLVANGQLSVGHAKALLGIRDRKAQRSAVDEVLRRKLTVRHTEKLVHDFQNGGPRKAGRKAGAGLDPATDAMIRAIVSRLRERFATHVSITHNAKKGRIELEYYGNDDLTRVLELMQVNLDDL